MMTNYGNLSILHSLHTYHENSINFTQFTETLINSSQFKVCTLIFWIGITSAICNVWYKILSFITMNWKLCLKTMHGWNIDVSPRWPTEWCAFWSHISTRWQILSKIPALYHIGYINSKNEHKTLNICNSIWWINVIHGLPTGFILSSALLIQSSFWQYNICDEVSVLPVLINVPIIIHVHTSKKTALTVLILGPHPFSP